MMYEIINKNIQLNSREKAEAAENLKGNAKFAKMPGFLLGLFIKSSLKKMREQSLLIKLPEVKISTEIEKTEYKSDAGIGGYSVFFYRRKGLSGGKYPLLFFIHGGGFVGGTYLANESLMKRLAAERDLVTASIEYHLSPEARFPAALRECETGLHAVLENNPDIDREKIFVSGDSAGGNFAACLALSLKNNHKLTPAGQILLYPVTEMSSLDTDSYKRREPEFASMFKLIKIMRKFYAASKKDYKNIYFSPLLSTADDDRNPTPALILLAGHDGLLSEGVMYGEHLRDLGGNVRTVIYENAFHAFINGLGDSDIAEDAYAEIVGFVR